MTGWPTLQKVIGGNVHRLRAQNGITQASLARAARAHGLRWHHTRVSELERGDLSLSLDTVVLLGYALQSLIEAPVTGSDLLAGDGNAQIGGVMNFPLALLRDFSNGEPFRTTDHLTPSYTNDAVESHTTDTAGEISKILGSEPDQDYYRYNRRGLISAQTETKALHSLSVSPSALSALSYVAWGRTLAEERDARAQPGDSPQKVGRITRELLSDLRALLAKIDG